MARRARSPHRSSARETWKLIAAGALALVTLAAAGWGMHLWATTPAAIQRDKTTLCSGSPPPSIIVIAMDTTDGLPKPTKREALTRLTDLVEKSSENALLEVRVVDPTQEAGRTIKTLCNPGDGRDVSATTGNPEMRRRQWHQSFRGPLVQALEDGLQKLPSKSSPLLSTFQGIALERFTGANVAAADKRLVIVSDMIEHVHGEYTQYPPADLRYDRFKKLPKYRKVRTDLQGAEVDIYYIDRSVEVPINTGVHIKFWIDWIDDNNGRIGKLIKLQGAGTS